MNYLIRIHDYNKPTEDDELWHVLGNRHWKRLALGHGQLLGVLTSDESAFEIQSALAQHLEWPSRCLAVPIGQDSPPPRYKQLPAWLESVGQPGNWTEGLRSSAPQ